VVTIGLIGQVATWIIKTWFTPTVSSASVVNPAGAEADIVAATAAMPDVAKVLINPNASVDLLQMARDTTIPKVQPLVPDLRRF
jgi:hypothetical protein